MTPSSSNRKKRNAKTGGTPAAPESAALTRREVFGTIALGLAIAGLAAGIVFLTGKKPAAAEKPDHPRRLAAFRLTDRTGRIVTQDDLAGKILVVNFVFTSCSLSCRAVNDRMEEIQRLVRDAADVQLVSLTVDPRSDTPSVLAKFADSFHADTNRWLFLTGEKPDVYDLIETSFSPKSPGLEQTIPGGFTSTDRIMLVAPDGTVCASFDGLKTGVSSAVLREIDQLRKSSKPK